MIGRIHRLFAAAGILLLLPTLPANAQERSGAPRFFSKRVRELDARIDAIRNELRLLPEGPSGSKGGTLGYHSNLWADPSTAISVTIDLGQEFVIDTIILIPASVVYGFSGSGGYGFPRGFRVDLSVEDTFGSPTVIADFTSGVFPDPGNSPAVFEAGGASGRFVRITATDLWCWPSNDRSLFALGEVLVYSGGQNIAPWKEVRASDSRDSEPLWSVSYLVDGQSSLGRATVPGTSSLSNGYHSEVAVVADVTKWVQVDLGAEFPLREIRLIPARPRDFPELQGFGFPERFVVECSNDPDFDEATVLMDRREVPFPNPGDNAVPISGDDQRARYVRCSATQLWKRDNDYVFALSELQVFSGPDNVALHAQVTSMDSIELGLWSEPYLVDGFDSRHQLDEDELRWLKGLARRHALELALADLTAERADRLDRVTRGLIISAVGGGFSMVVLLTTLVLRNRLHRRRETDNLRERIASDLHDEIGSNLGSIALLSEIAPGAASGELAEINRIARETGDSMRDIVWVIRIGHDSLEDLITRLREVAAEMLRNVPFSFKVEPDLMPSVQPDLNFKRNVLLFFKEALHNIIKHASADAVAIRILVSGQRFWLTVCDNGCGFDPAEASNKGGNGLNNLRTRAETLGAEIHIISSPGAGTSVVLDAAHFTTLRHLLGLTRPRDRRRSSIPLG